MTDPRYDPRFQRGWGGDPAASTGVPADPLAPARAEVAAAPAPTHAAAGLPRTEAVAAPVESEPTVPDDEAWIEQPRHNPFRIALAATGVALLAIGGWLIWVSWVTEAQQSTSTPDGAVLGQVLYQLMPTVVLAGLVALIAAIALGGRPR